MNKDYKDSLSGQKTKQNKNKQKNSRKHAMYHFYVNH
jgi:hypothetical protein